jgi:hypothetical protein
MNEKCAHGAQTLIVCGAESCWPSWGVRGSSGRRAASQRPAGGWLVGRKRPGCETAGADLCCWSACRALTSRETRHAGLLGAVKWRRGPHQDLQHQRRFETITPTGALPHVSFGLHDDRGRPLPAASISRSSSWTMRGWPNPRRSSASSPIRPSASQFGNKPSHSANDGEPEGDGVGL